MPSATRPLTRLLLSLTAVLLLAGARPRAVQHPSPLADPPRDAFSYSEPAKITTRHLALDLTVDFDRRRLSGRATLDVQNLTGTRTLVLDTEGLTISAVSRDGVPANFTVGPVGTWGAPLRIDVEPSTRRVSIDYTTGPAASGLNWVRAAQTYGRTQPFLYTQNEPISARSWIPLQDTPAVRMTYEATVHVPAGNLAIMSAGNNPRQVSATGVYHLAMEQTIPSYLIALAVGRLQFHAFDERTGVYAEPELIEDAALELQYMPEMLAAAERILGPHPFPRHDVLLAPPTYTIGGMEHPMLNFISPFAVVTGNRPNRLEPRDLLAHELAHSWAGDATTLGSWNDIWINEGVTSYLTQRIVEEMGLRERAEYWWFSERASYDWYATGLEDPTPTILHREAEDPYGFGYTAYTKGALFMRTLEDLLGRAALDRFLRDYFRAFSFRWVDDRNFIARLAASLGGPVDAGVRLNDWIYGTRLPSNVTAPVSSTLADRVAARVEAFRGGAAMASLDPQSWTETELQMFLSSLPSQGLRMADIDAALGLSLRVAPPTVWLRHAIANRYSPADAAIERVLMRGGPNGTMTAIYASLIPVDRDRARRIFDAAKERYHPNVVVQVERMFAQQAALANAA